MTAKTYDRQTAKFLAMVGENMPELPGDVMQRWIENPKILQEVLKKVFYTPEETSRFKVWKTIRLDVGPKTVEGFRLALMSSGFIIGNHVFEILKKIDFTVAVEETEMDLIKVTLGKLGLKKGALSSQIYKRAKELGLELCPPEVGPLLRLQYRDQPKDNWLLVGMEPIITPNGNQYIFGVGCNGSEPWLDGKRYPNCVWEPIYQLLFCLPRK